MIGDTAGTKLQGIAGDEQYDFHCITCSDEALSARVLSVDEATRTAVVQIGNATEEVDVSLLDAVLPGDTLLVHGGVALYCGDK